MEYTLHVTETANKSARYHYQIKNEDGYIISERKSNRQYVAATICGSCYFGRVDLAQKHINRDIAAGFGPTKMAYLKK